MQPQLYYDKINRMYDELLQQLIQLNFLPLGIVLFLAVFIVFNYPFEKKLSVYPYRAFQGGYPDRILSRKPYPRERGFIG